jgi:hypothetical protein
MRLQTSDSTLSDLLSCLALTKGTIWRLSPVLPLVLSILRHTKLTHFHSFVPCCFFHPIPPAPIPSAIMDTSKTKVLDDWLLVMPPKRKSSKSTAVKNSMAEQDVGPSGPAFAINMYSVLLDPPKNVIQEAPTFTMKVDVADVTGVHDGATTSTTGFGTGKKDVNRSPWKNTVNGLYLHYPKEERSSKLTIQTNHDGRKRWKGTREETC